MRVHIDTGNIKIMMCHTMTMKGHIGSMMGEIGLLLKHKRYWFDLQRVKQFHWWDPGFCSILVVERFCRQKESSSKNKQRLSSRNRNQLSTIH